MKSELRLRYLKVYQVSLTEHLTSGEPPLLCLVQFHSLRSFHGEAFLCTNETNHSLRWLTFHVNWLTFVESVYTCLGRIIER